MAAVEIVKSPSVIHVKTQVGGPMPSFRASDTTTAEPPTKPASAPPPPPPKPTTPSAPPLGKKLPAAPPVPPPADTRPALKPNELPKTPAKDAMFKKLREKGQGQEQAKLEAEEAKPEDPTGTTPADERAEDVAPEDADTSTEQPTDGSVKSATTDKPKEKVNPWKKLKEREAELAELNTKYEETRKLIADESVRKQEIERLTTAEKRAKELEDEIRYVNYSKSEEFKTKYWDPYEQSYNNALVELKELEITNESGETRPVSQGDFNELLFAPTLMKAKALATEKFGDYADDVMALRKDVRKLFEEQAMALRRARDEGSQREQQMARQQQETFSKVSSYAKETWEKAHQSLIADPEDGSFFKPVEGDEERNTTLQKGYELVDTGARENPLDPSLTPQQVASIVKKHVAIRARAAAYNVIKGELKKVQGQLNEALEKLKQYESSTPTTEGGRGVTAPPTYTRASDRVFAKLRSLAK